MEPLSRGLLTAGGAVLSLWLAQLSHRRRLPGPPLRLMLLALLSWLLLGGGLPAGLNSPTRLWLGLLDDLLLSFAAVRLLLWLSLELPGGLHWWRRPPDLLLQLLMVGLGAVISVVVVRETARIDLVGLVTTSAVLTAVLGLAAQGALKDLLAGLELQLGDDFGVGDWLELGQGVQGIVETISWRDTQLRTMEGVRLVVPNSQITAGQLAIKGAYGAVSNRFELGLDYAVPPHRARALLLGVLQGHPRVLAEPEPQVRLKSFGESAIVYDLQAWQAEAGQKAVDELRSELLEQLWYAVKRAGWSIPYPVRELQPRRSQHQPGELQNISSQHCAEKLAANALFIELSPEQRLQLASTGPQLHYGPGETVVQEGAGGDSLFLVLDGGVEVWKQQPQGGEIKVSGLGPGDIFGEMTLFLDAPRSATVRTHTESLLLRIDRASFRPLVDANPRLLEALARQVSERQAQLTAITTNAAPTQASGLLETMRKLLQVFQG
jgi:small-conductance mechanosensitive channel/CRP-like cAMP-binding protein